VATWQAQAAGDGELRAAMASISVDEAQHAELGFAVARWAESRLDRAARDRVRDARRAAVEALAISVDAEPPPSLAAYLMSRATAREMMTQLARDYWS
jgi:hypothetical protein